MNGHPHGICDKCGDIFDISTTQLDHIIDDVQKDTDFEINSYHVYFSGVCSDCRQGH